MELHFVTESRYERDESVRISAFGPGMTAEREKARRRNTAITIEAIKMQTIFKSIAEHHVDTVLMWYCRTASSLPRCYAQFQEEEEKNVVRTGILRIYLF